MNKNFRLKATVGYALDWLGSHGHKVTPAIADLAVAQGIKTADYYNRVIGTWINDLYTGGVSENDFVDRFAELIDQQLTRAWREGMRENGLSPDDMTEEMQAILTEIIANEYTFVDQFAADIADGKFTLAQLQARGAMWGQRYDDTVNRAKLESADLKDKYEWVYGDTDHCETCSRLNGLVATAKEWTISGIKPQSPPNENLECGGWRCGCRLVPTKKRRTPKVLDALLTIGAR